MKRMSIGIVNKFQHFIKLTRVRIPGDISSASDFLWDSTEKSLDNLWVNETDLDDCFDNADRDWLFLRGSGEPCDCNSNAVGLDVMRQGDKRSVVSINFKNKESSNSKNIDIFESGNSLIGRVIAENRFWFFEIFDSGKNGQKNGMEFNSYKLI